MAFKMNGWSAFTQPKKPITDDLKKVWTGFTELFDVGAKAKRKLSEEEAKKKREEEQQKKYDEYIAKKNK